MLWAAEAPGGNQGRVSVEVRKIKFWEMSRWPEVGRYLGKVSCQYRVSFSCLMLSAAMTLALVLLLTARMTLLATNRRSCRR